MNECSSEKQVETAQYLAGINIDEVTFGTMEPFLCNSIDQLIQILTNEGKETHVITNGILLDDDERFQKAIDAGLRKVFISLEGVSPETNDAIRGPGTFETVKSVLHRLNAHKKNNGELQFGVQLSINAFSSSEADKIPAFFEMFDEMDILSIGEIGEVGNAAENKHIIISTMEFLTACEKIVHAYNKGSKTFTLAFKSLLPHEINHINLVHGTELTPIIPTCGAATGTYSVLADGTIHPCVLLRDHDFAVFQSSINDEGIIRDMAYENALLEKVAMYKRNSTCFSCKYATDCIPCINQLRNDQSVFERCKHARIKSESMMEEIIARCIDQIKLRETVDFIVNRSQRSIYVRKKQEGGYYSQKYKYEAGRVEALEALRNGYSNSDKKRLMLQANKTFIKEVAIDGFLEGVKHESIGTLLSNVSGKQSEIF